MSERPPRGNMGTPDIFFEAVAVEAGRIKREGLAVGPTLAQRRNCDVSTAKRWIREARDRGLLAPRGWKLGPDHPARKEDT